MASPICDSGGKDIEPYWFGAVQVVEDSPAAESLLYLFENILADAFKEGMPRRYPFESRVIFEEVFVEDDLLVLAAELTIPRLKAITHGPESARELADAKLMGVLLDLLGMNTSYGGGIQEKVLHRFWDKATLFGFGCFI
jgi:hypothetical protein